MAVLCVINRILVESDRERLKPFVRFECAYAIKHQSACCYTFTTKG